MKKLFDFIFVFFLFIFFLFQGISFTPLENQMSLTGFKVPSFLTGFIFAQTSQQGDVVINALVPGPSEPAEEEQGGGVILFPDTVPPGIFEIEITDITRNSVKISWKTDELTIPQINYGLTKDYEKTIIGKNFSLSALIVLENLIADRVYHFEIVAIDRSGNRTSSGDLVFKTLSPPDIFPPANIIDFEAVASDSQISLSWQNPPDSDFEAVKIKRSIEFYPSNPEEGITVYDGKGNSLAMLEAKLLVGFIDTDLTNEKTYYYTAFAYDESGNYSSGAIVSAIPFKIKPLLPPEEIISEEECVKAGHYWYEDSCHPEKKISPAPPEIKKLTLEDFEFFQEDQKLLITETGVVDVKHQQPITISIPYENVPEVLKTMMVTLEKDKKSFSFLLRINKEKTEYLAGLIPPEEPGQYPLTITVLDYKNQTLKHISGKMIVKKEVLTTPSEEIIWFKNLKIWLYVLGGIIILFGILIKFRRKIKKDQRAGLQ